MRFPQLTQNLHSRGQSSTSAQPAAGRPPELGQQAERQALQRLDRNDNYAPNDTSLVAVIDCATDSLVDVFTTPSLIQVLLALSSDDQPEDGAPEPLTTSGMRLMPSTIRATLPACGDVMLRVMTR